MKRDRLGLVLAALGLLATGLALGAIGAELAASDTALNRRLAGPVALNKARSSLDRVSLALSEAERTGLPVSALLPPEAASGSGQTQDAGAPDQLTPASGTDIVRAPMVGVAARPQDARVDAGSEAAVPADAGPAPEPDAAVARQAERPDSGAQVASATTTDAGVVQFVPLGIPCGHNTCNVDQYCCNASCGTCMPLGQVCDQSPCTDRITQPFSVTCGMATCNVGMVCCNASCGICARPGERCTTRVCY